MEAEEDQVLVTLGTPINGIHPPSRCTSSNATGEYYCPSHGLWTCLTVLFAFAVSLAQEPQYLPTIIYIW